MLCKKIVTCLVCILFVTSALIVVQNMKNDNIIASGSPIPNNNGIGLNYTYLWQVTTYLSNAVHKYNTTMIPKGRAFGSWGCEEYSQDYIYRQMANTLGLTDTKLEKLGPINDTLITDLRYYTSFVNVEDYRLTIEHPQYGWTIETQGLPRNVPWSECFVSPSCVGIKTQTHEMDESDDVRVISHFDNGWPEEGTLTDDYMNVSCSTVSGIDFICGNVTLINNSSELPTDQTGMVFLVNETDDCEEILENITNASGVVLLYSDERGYTIPNTPNFSSSLKRVNASDENLTNIIALLKQGEIVFADNFYDNTTITFTYGLDLLPWPNYNFMLITPMYHLNEGDIYNWITKVGIPIFLLNPFHPFRQCKGLLAYSDDTEGETHYMISHTVEWYPFGPFPFLPVIFLNNTVGKFLYNHTDYSDNTISGFIDQVFYKENHVLNPGSGIDEYNIVGHINIPESPNDAQVVISNRYDSFWGECSLDSGAGAGIVLGIAKYFKEHQITPKYNLTFIEDTGEEYGFRGAQHYSDNHSQDNVILFIGADQLGMEQPGTYLNFIYKDPTTRKIVRAIVNETHYDQRTKYGPVNHTAPDDCHNVFLKPFGDMTDGTVWKRRNLFGSVPCDTIVMNKEGWTSHHQTGLNFNEGDSLKNTNRSDLNISLEVFWNITKYFTVNPDCWFSDVSYQAVDSPNDSDPLNDSINATFTIHTSLPNDKIQVIAFLWPEYYWEPVTYANVSMNYTVTSANITDTVTVTLPPGMEAGNYWLRLSLYNSTGRINLITKISNLEDDENHSQCYNLSPRGNDPPATPHKPSMSTNLLVSLHEYNYTTNTTDQNQDQIQYEWDWKANTTHQYETTGFYPSGANCTLSHAYRFWEYKCIKVRAIDQYGAASNWSEPLDLFMQQFTTFDMSSQDYVAVVSQPSNYYGHIYGNLQEPANWTWSFIGRSFGAENYRSYTQNTEKTFTVLSDYNVTLTVTDIDTSTVNITRTITTKNLHAEFTTNYTGSIPPGNTIAFTNHSIGRYPITNQTWDFDDGTRSYDKNPTHVYTTPGVYNVTLTVRDSQSNNDTSYQLLSILTDDTPPEIQLVTHELAVIQDWFTVGLVAFINDHESGIHQASINITYPDQTYGNYTMIHLFNNVYSYIFNDTDTAGEYNYTIWVTDYENNTNSATGYSFTIPAPPVLFYTAPTPTNSTVTNRPWVNVNVTVLDLVNTSAFIDWNRSLKGYWHMDFYNNTGIYDNSTYDNFGTFQNGLNTSSIKTGKYGKGLEFDGTNDYVDLGSGSSLDMGTGDFTFMVWEKSHVSSYSKKAMILTNSPASENWKGYGFGVVNHAYLFVSQSSGNNVTVQGAADVTDNTWHHIAYVRHSGAYSIYVDRAFDADSGQLRARNITNAQNTTLAYDGHASNWCYFDGMLDEPQLYNRALSREEINASYNNGLYQLYHNFTGLTEGTYSYYAHAIDTTGNMSQTEVRTVTVDFDPQITMVSASPHTVGFGFNVTISANVTDPGTGVNTVNVNITYPDHNYGNYTMSHTTGNTYQYVFSSTWQTGQYNFTIWAMDETYNSNSSGGHHFHVSAAATISISTLKDSYGANQYINITDPPNPPENYTLVDRGLTWNTYYNASTGENILEAYQGPVNYQENNGTWTPINNTFYQLAANHPAYVYGYRNGNNHGLYGVYFKSNAQNDWPVAFTYNRSEDPTIHVIRSKLVGVGYVDPQSNWAYQYLQNVQSSQGQTNGNVITYANVFTGTDVTWSYGDMELKEAITLSNATKTVLQNHPPSLYGLNDASSYLVFITKLDHQNLNMFNASGMLIGNVTISDTGVEFKDALGQFKCALPLGEAYELNNESVRQKLTYRIVHLNGNTYLLSGLRISDLTAMTFPVVIDPTLTVYSTSSDGYIYNYNTNYDSVQTASSGIVSGSEAFITIGQRKQAAVPSSVYYIYRGFVFFNTSSLPSNAYLDNATLSLYKKDDYSATDFDITIQNGQPTYPHDPMQSGDYNKNDYSGNGGTLNTSKFTNGYNDIQVSNLNWITKGGTTKLCLRSSRDINGNEPTGNEYANVHSSEFLGMCGPKLVIMYRNQSKIKNTGSTDIKGYLLIQVQFYNTSQGKWLVANDTVNETTSRTINCGSQLALDTIFNGKIRASNLQHGAGTYRVYTTFRDPEGNILKTNSGSELKAWWQFNKT